MSNEKYVCSNCGATIKKSDEYCDNCGLTLVNPKEEEKYVKELKEKKFYNTVNGLMTLGDVIKVLLIIASIILFISSFSYFNNQNDTFGTTLLIDSIILFISSFILPLTFYWCSYMLDDVHTIRKSLKK